MKITKLLLIITLLISMFTLVSCKASPKLAVILDSNEVPRISVENDMFDITPNEFIEVFNEELDNRGLQTANRDYDEISDDIVRLYKANINENTSLMMIAFNEIGDKIVWLQIKSTEEVDRVNDRAEEYYQALTTCICPEFNVSGFMNTGSETFKTYDYKELHFQYDQYNQEFTSNDEQTVRLYYVTTNKANTYYRKVYEEYSNRIEELEMLM